MPKPNYICGVPGCTNIIRARGLCGKHYERMRTHGDVNADFRSGEKPKTPCSVVGCENSASALGMCTVHYQRVHRHGSTESLIPNYGKGSIHRQGYRRIWLNGKFKMEHVILAEKALGKPLPTNAVVHHVNSIPWDNSTYGNLVICPDQLYHFLLHKRTADYEKYGRCFPEISVK